MIHTGSGIYLFIASVQHVHDVNYKLAIPTALRKWINT